MSRWEIRIATLIGAIVVGIAPPTTAAAEQPGLAIATLETLPVRGAHQRLDIPAINSGRHGLMSIAMGAIPVTIC